MALAGERPGGGLAALGARQSHAPVKRGAAVGGFGSNLPARTRGAGRARFVGRTQQQGRGAAHFRSQLQATRLRQIDGIDFGDHGGQSRIAQRFLESP